MVILCHAFCQVEVKPEGQKAMGAQAQGHRKAGRESCKHLSRLTEAKGSAELAPPRSRRCSLSSCRQQTRPAQPGTATRKTLRPQARWPMILTITHFAKLSLQLLFWQKLRLLWPGHLPGRGVQALIRHCWPSRKSSVDKGNTTTTVPIFERM